jgi:hypothetical protein
VLGDALEPEAVARGELTPMFFGSAMTNFGVDIFLRAFIDSADRPGAPRRWGWWALGAGGWGCWGWDGAAGARIPWEVWV